MVIQNPSLREQVCRYSRDEMQADHLDPGAAINLNTMIDAGDRDGAARLMQEVHWSYTVQENDIRRFYAPLTNGPGA
jgi:hypothetical protein